MKSYPAYQPSGLPWLGQIPAHWKVGRLKTLANNIIEQTSSAMPGETVLALEHIESWTGFIRTSRSNLVLESQVKRFKPYDVLFGKLRPYLAKVARPSFEGTCVSEFFVLRPRGAELLPEFLEQLLRSKPIIDVINSSTFGAKMPRADWSFVGDLMLAFPPLPEQRAIARYLAYHDRLTRRYLRAKQKMIALLNEQKQALIHRAVTRGLDPNVKLKPSGIEWLLEIPEHWTAVRAGTLASMLQTGPFGSQLHSNEYEPNETPVINPSHMKDGKIIPDPNCAIGPAKISKLLRHCLKLDDIIFARRGELGRCALVTEAEVGWLCGTGSLNMRLKDKAGNPKYLLQLFLSKGVSEWLSLQSVGSTMENLNTGILARLPLPLPPESEQHAIIDFIASQQRLADIAITYIQREIALLREYRTRLIADVVTGKVDVREAAAGLPEEESAMEEEAESAVEGEAMPEDTVDAMIELEE